MYLTHFGAIALAFSALSIVRRADVADEEVLRIGAQYPAVVALGRIGDATLVHPRWLVTAAHVASAVERRGLKSVRIGGRDHDISGVVLHPGWRELGPHDIALIFLAHPVRGVTPIELSRDQGELREVAVLVGHGASGTGSSRVRNEDRRRRAATSRVDSVDHNAIYFSFDAPPGGTAVEGAPGRGDSGGPALIRRDGIVTVAGISSAGTDGRSGPATYGAVDVFTRVSTHRAWTDSVMAAGRPRTPAESRNSGKGSPAIPSTPAGRHMVAFLQAARSGNAGVEKFVREHFDPRETGSRPALTPNMVRIAGILRNARVEEVVRSEATEVAVRFATDAGPFTLAFVCDAAAPHKILDWRRYD